MNVLGISAFYHDSAACLLAGDDLVAAAQEERFTRIKGDERFPRHASRYCLDEAGITISDLDAVVFYEKPLVKFERLIDTYLDIAPRGLRSFRRAAPLWLKDRLYIERDIRSALGGYKGKILYTEHHEAHAGSAYFPSPFDEAAILTIDGVGEWATATIGVGRGSELELLEEMRFPNSLGLLYSAFTYHAGFRVNSGEYKLMGLAPFGAPRYVERIHSQLLDLNDDGSFALNQKFFDYRGGLRMTNRNFDRLFDGPPRAPEGPLTQREMDLACSVQQVTEEIVLRMARHAHRRTGLDKLCMAGGVALNAVANGRLQREGPFAEIWVQPAAGDAGGAIGAAYCAMHKYFGHPRTERDGSDSMKGTFLGPAFTPGEISETLGQAGVRYDDLSDGSVEDCAAELISEGKVVGWFQGRMEFGPRALGARSILADARDPEMQSRLNRKIKFREGFRPFAPSVLSERAAEYFDIVGESPYMTSVVPVLESRRVRSSERSGGLKGVSDVRSQIPAVTHLDYSARVQTVSRDRNPILHGLISAFAERTGCPLVVNTSFNVRGEPIVATPDDALACFARTAIDALVIGPFVVRREMQSKRSLAAAATALVGTD
ncbi:MAG TPA: carbamoyltransferase [Gemmatimonadaceae bacterium]|jgi:carbamoyltransferase|nr:carbamoyltransferase [Gemmatimonadaceae bacterium]